MESTKWSAETIENWISTHTTLHKKEELKHKKTEMPIDSPTEKKRKDCQHGKKKKKFEIPPKPAGMSRQGKGSD
jgi:hypothetical protein